MRFAWGYGTYHPGSSCITILYWCEATLCLAASKVLGLLLSIVLNHVHTCPANVQALPLPCQLAGTVLAIVQFYWIGVVITEGALVCLLYTALLLHYRSWCLQLKGGWEYLSSLLELVVSCSFAYASFSSKVNAEVVDCDCQDDGW